MKLNWKLFQKPSVEGGGGGGVWIFSGAAPCDWQEANLFN